MSNDKLQKDSTTSYTNNKSGYTLIEILVSLTIIGIVFGFGYASYRDFSRRQALKDAAKIVQGDLRFAQENAIAGQKPAGCSTTLVGYNFNVYSTSAYRIEADCGSTTITVKDVTVPSDITLVIPSLNPLLFKVLGQGTNIGSSNWELLLNQTGTLNQAKVIVTSGGEIK